MKCRACFSENLNDFVDLGYQPASNDFRGQASHCTETYPLKMLVCEDCGLGQLSETVDPEYIFKDYMYFSSQSPSWVEDRRTLAHRMINEFQPSHVIDIGSNDGYYLKHFHEKGVATLGYEPAANVAQVARAAGIETRTEFWGRSTRECADLINATNVLAHTPDMDGFVEGVSASLLPDGVATFEFPLFSNLISNNQLDTIYHEHYSYISVNALQKVLDRHHLRIWRIERLATHGGSVRVFACKEKARFFEESSVAYTACTEVWAPGQDFERRAQGVKWDLLKFLADVRGESHVVGYGAPAKATVLCNYLGLDASIIDCTIDDSPYKQGKFVPGTNIPIVSFEEGLDVATPDYILLFAWNLLDPIRRKLQDHYYGCTTGVPKLVTAIPELTLTTI